MGPELDLRLPAQVLKNLGGAAAAFESMCRAVEAALPWLQYGLFAVALALLVLAVRR
jgi:hypothetical protein